MILDRTECLFCSVRILGQQDCAGVGVAMLSDKGKIVGQQPGRLAVTFWIVGRAISACHNDAWCLQQFCRRQRRHNNIAKLQVSQSAKSVATKLNSAIESFTEREAGLIT